VKAFQLLAITRKTLADTFRTGKFIFKILMQTICYMKSDMRVGHELLNAVLFILCYHLPKAEIDVLLVYVQALLASQIARLS